MTLFGRLDILFPDGQRENHQLHGGAITIGSADSCSIQLADPSVADRHLRLDVSADNVTITDLASAAGTFVDGQRLPAYTPVPLRDTADIMIGPLRLTFYRRSDSPTIAMPALSEQTQPALIGFRAHLENAPATVFPASNVTLPLNITNTSDSDAEFRVEVSGLPDNWVTPDRLTFPLPAGEETQLLFLVKPERRSDIPPQRFAPTVNITRLDERQSRLRLVGIIELGGFGGLSLAIDPPVCQDSGSFNLYLLNQGNEPLTLALRCEESRLDLRLGQASLTLLPGGRAQVPGSARSRQRPLVGQTRQLPFVVIAQAENPAGYRVPLPASVSVTPLLSGRLAALLAVVIFAAVALAALLLFQPPEPVIKELSLSQAQVAQGTPVELSWSAEHAGRYIIEVDRVPVAELPADASSYSLDTRHYTDPVDIALIAQQGDATAIASIRLDIYQPVKIVQFYADRTSMLRNVFATLTVRWAVDGAVSLEFSRPLGFETASESRASNAHGEFALRGAPSADFEILLSATDEIGNISQQALQIAIRDPECSPRRDVLLYAGPDPRHNQVKVAVEYVPVLARGTNQNRDWLQVELASGHTGWGAYSSFLCQGFTPANLEIITDIPPLPTATPSSTPTETPSPTPSPTATMTFTPTATATEP